MIATSILGMLLFAATVTAFTVAPRNARVQLVSNASRQDRWPFGMHFPSHFPWQRKNTYSGNIPDSADKLQPAEGGFRQRLDNLGDVQYTAIIRVGGQPMKAVIDTGSFELVVFGRNCTACGQTSHLYDRRKSQTYEFSGFKGIHTYGSGTTYSEESFDSFSINDEMTVPRQSFWEVYEANMPILSQDSFQMIFGVGPPNSAARMAHQDADEIHQEFEQYKKDGKVTPRVSKTVQYYDRIASHAEHLTSVSEHLRLENMSVCLGKSSGSDGYFVWNETAPSTEPEKFAQVEVVGDFYWSANMTDITIGSMPEHGKKGKPTKIGCFGNKSCSAVIDTGTSLLTAPSDAVAKIRDLVDKWVEQGGSCDDLSGLPDLEFKLGGVKLTLPPQAYVGKVDGNYGSDIQRYMPHLAAKSPEGDPAFSLLMDNNCDLLIMSMDADSQYGPLWIIGMPFFRKYFTNFHFQDNGKKHPEAKAMSFSVADSKCRPNAHPHDVAANEKLLLGVPGIANLNVDASKILVPSLARQAHALKGSGLYGRPVFHI